MENAKSGLKSFLATLMLIIGLGIVSYPTVSNWWNEIHSSQMISTYARHIEEIDEDQLSTMLAAAAEYNRHIPERNVLYAMTSQEKRLYGNMLKLDESGLMGYIDIPKINVHIPIYHGTSDDVLQKAIGHIEWSSLPVGGKGSHAVLSGHRGLPKARLFTDLDKLKEGDEFTITILNRSMKYRVDQIRTVLPSELSDLTIVDGEDYCTLVTCTPYGVNTHRYLVRGKRIEGADVSSATIRPDAYAVPISVTIPAFAIPTGLVMALMLTIAIRIRKMREQKAAEVRKRMMAEIQGGSVNAKNS